MASDIFIRIDGIEGESTDEQHPGWIEVFNFALGVKQNVSSTPGTAGGAATERSDFRPLNFKRPLDKASPKLAMACAGGTHIDEILVEVCRAGGRRVKNRCVSGRVRQIFYSILPKTNAIKELKKQIEPREKDILGVLRREW